MAKRTNNSHEESLEKKLWKAADKLRKNMDAAEYKHVALGLIFLKYISDAFEELHQKLDEGKGEYEGADPEDKNEYTAEKVFYVPPSARWKWLQGRAKLPTIGKDIDDAMEAIEKDNPKSLRGVLPKVYAQEKLDKQSLGALVDLFSTATLGTKEAQSKDVLGKVFEYFLGEFALAEGKKGGQFYTPSSVVRLLVEMLEPYEGRVFDPCCGSGGMFVQSEKFIESHSDHYNPPAGRAGKKNGKGLNLNRNKFNLKILKTHPTILNIDTFLQYNSVALRTDEFTFMFKENSKFETLIQKIPKTKTPKNFISFGYQKNKKSYIFLIDVHEIGEVESHSFYFDMLLNNTLQFLDDI